MSKIPYTYSRKEFILKIWSKYLLPVCFLILIWKFLQLQTNTDFTNNSSVVIHGILAIVGSAVILIWVLSKLLKDRLSKVFKEKIVSNKRFLFIARVVVPAVMWLLLLYIVYSSWCSDRATVMIILGLMLLVRVMEYFKTAIKKS
ncbi:MAG: hypothetical protein WBA16_07710 [Nonlabens sp.]